MRFRQYLRIAARTVQLWGWAIQIVLMFVGLVVRPGTALSQVDPNEIGRFCGEDEVRCLREEYDKFDSCLFVYIKQTSWFGMIDRWYVYSIRGGPTVSLRDFMNAVYIDRRDAARATDYLGRLLDEIGVRELRRCDVNFYLECVDGQELDSTTCQQRTNDGVGKWESERLSPDEVRNILQSEN